MDSRRALPSIERLLQSEAAHPLLELHPRPVVAEALRQVLAEIRAGPDGPVSELVLISRAANHLAQLMRGSLRPIINATGVILHTNLGRAPLGKAARAAMEAIACGYSTLEYDLEAGERGSRHDHLTPLLQRLTGAEAALVVNNNASSVLLALTALAAGQEVVISRGQLVEIGGGFRIPDVLRQSGARLVEVGTTNRTYVDDYRSAISEAAAMLLRVHPSNFQVTGFVHTTPLAELVELARAHSLLVVDDLGSGSLLATERFGLAHEPMVQESVAAGADLVCFSGDKLLGGPQAGILVGKEATIAALCRHPLMRALRPDKGTIAALYATLLHYDRGEGEREIPVWRMIATPTSDLEARGEIILDRAAIEGAGLIASEATIGGGSLPGETLASRAIALRPIAASPQRLSEQLRRLDPPIIGHIADERVVLDLRTVAPDEDDLLVAALRAVSG